MSNLNELIDLIQNDDQVKRFKELESIIDQDEKLQAQYQELLLLQKDMVQKEVKMHPEYQTSKQTYETAKSAILENIIMGEYLELVEQINNDLSLVKKIIEQEINNELD